MSVPFNLEILGGMIVFGSAPIDIVIVPVSVTPNGGGTSGHLGPAMPPATISCATPQPVVLLGALPFHLHGTAVTPFGKWDIKFEFPPSGVNQGSLSSSSLSWELTGEYVMAITDTVAGDQCAHPADASGEFQFAGPPLAGWPHSCFTKPPTKKLTYSAGQSPGLEGSLVLHGHAGVFPTFSACSPTLAAHANGLIAKKGFQSAHLKYKLTY